jgi:hypothetical protein
MTRTKFVGAAMLVMGLAAASAAGADIITLDVSGTFTPSTGTGAACSPTCTLGGDIVIDNSSGAANQGFVSADVTATGFSPSVGPFTQFSAVNVNLGTGGNTNLVLFDSKSTDLAFVFTTPTAGSLVDYTGSQVALARVIIPAHDSVSQVIWNGSGSLTAVPEPATWAMALLGFAGLGFAARRRAKLKARWASSNRRRPAA